MLLGRPWIHDTEAVPSSLYQKVRFPHEGAILTIYGNTLTTPKPIFGIDSKKELLTLDGFEIKRLALKEEKRKWRRSLWIFLPIATIMWWQ